MVAATLRKWLGVQRNNYTQDDHTREIDGTFLGRQYSIVISNVKSYACYYAANSRGEFVLWLHRFYFKWNLRKRPINMTWDANHDAPQWGFSLVDGPDLMVYWGQHPATPKRAAHTRVTLLPLPFSWRRYRDYSLDHTQAWVDITKEPICKEQQRVWSQSFVYTTKHGEVQNAQATMTVTKRVYRRTWLRWLPWQRTERFVRLDFNTGIGHDRSGWKGGVYGGSVELGERETPPQALERLVKEQHYG